MIAETAQMTTRDATSMHEGAAPWDEIVTKINSELGNLGERCLEYVGRGLALKIPPKEFESRLTTLVARATRYRERDLAQSLAKTAARLSREVRRANHAGLSNAEGVDLWELSQCLERQSNPDRPEMRKPNWPQFVARDIAELYAAAFDRKPGSSQARDAKGKARAGGPFVDFAHFIISVAPYVKADNGYKKNSIAKCVTTERATIDRVWARHEKLQRLLGRRPA